MPYLDIENLVSARSKISESVKLDTMIMTIIGSIGPPCAMVIIYQMPCGFGGGAVDYSTDTEVRRLAKYK
jgi:hypothetical protein